MPKLESDIGTVKRAFVLEVEALALSDDPTDEEDIEAGTIMGGKPVEFGYP